MEVKLCERCEEPLRNPRRNQRFCSKTCLNSRPRLSPKEKSWTTENKVERHRRERLKRNGWTPEEYVEALNLQQGRCAICGSEKPLHADHDHQTGLRRDLLCFECNNGLGCFKDNIEALGQAMQYLTKHQRTIT